MQQMHVPAQLRTKQLLQAYMAMAMAMAMAVDR
jgi:hypothetical protein